MQASVVNTSMSGPMTASALFHVFVFGVFIMGAPVLRDDPVIYDQPMAVEIADMDKITQTNLAPLKAPKPKKKDPSARPVPLPEPQEMRQRASARKPQPPKNTVKSLPKPAAPMRPDQTAEVAELTKPDKPAPVPQPEEAEAQDQPETKPEESIDVAQSMNNLLVSLVGEEEPVPQAQEPEKPQSETQGEPQPAPQISRLGDRLTISERDALRHQLSQCWNVPAGARNAEDLVVIVRLTVNPDKTVRDVQIIDRQNKYGRDPFYTTAADAARRAVLNAECSPLRLPDGKYEEWKNTVVRFDPSQMF